MNAWKKVWKVCLQIPLTKKDESGNKQFFFTWSSLNSIEAIETQSWKSWNDLPFAAGAPDVMAPGACSTLDSNEDISLHLSDSDLISLTLGSLIKQTTTTTVTRTSENKRFYFFLSGPES